MSTNLLDDARDDFFTRKGASNKPPPFFIGRQSERDAAKTAVRTGRHLLYLGPRGIGKTYCVWQISTLFRQASMAQAQDNVGVIPIRSDEDFRDFPDLQEFVLEIFLRLGKEIAPLDTVESLRIVGRGQREQDAGAHRAYMDKVLTGPWRNNKDDFFSHLAQDLHNTFQKLERRGVLFLENLDDFVERILGNEAGEQERFIHFLDQANLVLIATSTTHPPAWKHTTHPFYGRFDLHALQEFSLEEAREMLMQLAKSQEDTVFQHDITQRPGMIDTLYSFTGGNARSLAMCYTAVRAQQGKKKNIRQALSSLLSSSTPYYQERLKRRGLTALRLKLLIHLVRFDKPMSQEALANKLGEKENDVHIAMAWLQDHHYVKTQDIPGRAQTYIVKDTLFRMWMEVRQTPDSLRRIANLISFFEIIHEGKNPSKAYEQGVGDISAWETTPEDHEILKKRLNKVWLQALPEKIYTKSKSLYDDQNAGGLWDHYENVMRGRSLKETETLKHFETLVAVFLFFLRDFQQSNALFETIFQTYTINDEAVWWVYSRSLLLGQERLETVVTFNEKWRREWPGKPFAAYYHLGVARLMERKYDEAVEAFDRCLTLEANDWSVRKPVILGNKGQALLLSNRVNEALESCLSAIQIKGGEKIPQIHRNLVGIYLTMGNTEKAKDHLLQTIQCLKDYRDSRNLDMSLRILFQFITDESPLADDSVRLVETFVRVTRHGLNRVRIQRLLNDLITSGKLTIARKIIDTFKNGPYQIMEMFLPYVYAFEIFSIERIRDRNKFKKELLPEIQNATEIILQMIQTTQEEVSMQKR